MMDQLEPFQCSTSAGLLGVFTCPTAHTSRAESPDPALSGLIPVPIVAAATILQDAVQLGVGIGVVSGVGDAIGAGVAVLVGSEVGVDVGVGAGFPRRDTTACAGRAL
jgi:hypothetical protein